MHLGLVRYFFKFLLIAIFFQNSLQLTPLSIKTDTNKKIYVERFFPANWFKANLFCKFHGMELLTLDSKKEISVLKSALTDAGIAGNFWTGGNDLAETGQWSWASNGNWNPKIAEWAPAEPNLGVEHCVELYGSNNLEWNNAQCTVERYFICQFEESNAECRK